MFDNSKAITKNFITVPRSFWSTLTVAANGLNLGVDEIEIFFSVLIV